MHSIMGEPNDCVLGSEYAFINMLPTISVPRLYWQHIRESFCRMEGLEDKICPFCRHEVERYPVVNIPMWLWINHK